MIIFIFYLYSLLNKSNILDDFLSRYRNSIDNDAATRAGKLAVNEAFTIHGLQCVESKRITDNAPSNKAALNISGLFEGTFRNKLFHNGRSNTANCYSIVPEDYKI